MKRARTRVFRKAAPAAAMLPVPFMAAVSSFENRSGYSGQWELGSGIAELLPAGLIKADESKAS